MSYLRVILVIAAIMAIVGCSGGEKSDEPPEIPQANESSAGGTAAPLERPRDITTPQRSVPMLATGERIKTWVFECDDYDIVARFETRDALVETPDGGFRLFPEEVPGGGKMYTNGEATLWHNGDMATFEIDGRRYENCEHNPKKAVWEDARWRGVSFRGVGNEPGWLLEIGINSIVFEANYGEDQYVFPSAIPELDTETMSATYNVYHKDHTIKITLRNETCTDTMADDQFETSVEVLLDETTTYSGCGRVFE